MATQGLLYLEWPYHFQLDFLWYAPTVAVVGRGRGRGSGSG